MAEQTPQEKAGQASAQPGHGAVSAAEVERFIGGINFPADKNQLVDHAKSQGAPQEVLDLMSEFPEQQYSSVADVAVSIGQVKH